MSRLSAFFAAALMAVLPFAAATPASAQQTPAGISIPIESTTPQGVFNGVLRITSFGVQNNALVASGMVTGSVTGPTGVQAIAQSVTLPVNTSGTAQSAIVSKAAASTSCGILHLTLGPLDLDLLGLTVHLDRVVLDISAVPGAGNLLGNLLCSVTNLLNTSGSLTQIANLLNQILGLL